jgi:hypothetical protein
MNPLQGCDLRLEVDEVLEPGAMVPTLFAGHGPGGDRYLVLQTAGDGPSATWMCAPISERALSCVRTGQADLRDAFTHTATGTVDIVTVEPNGHWTETLKLCHELADEELPPVGRHLYRCA